MTERPSITCPRCGATSYHPEDIANRYCGRCHKFWGDEADYAAAELAAARAGLAAPPPPDGIQTTAELFAEVLDAVHEVTDRELPPEVVEARLQTFLHDPEHAEDRT